MGIKRLQSEIATLENKLSCVLCHSTGGKLSYTTYDLQTMYTHIDDYQQEFHYNIVKQDLQALINDGGTIEDLQKYLNDL